MLVLGKIWCKAKEAEAEAEGGDENLSSKAVFDICVSAVAVLNFDIRSTGNI